jgi:hypothetical protein
MSIVRRRSVTRIPSTIGRAAQTFSPSAILGPNACRRPGGGTREYGCNAETYALAALVVEQFAELDMLGLLQQIGAVPPL